MRMYTDGMTVAIQIKDVPDEVRDVLAKRAAERGQSTQQYLRGLLEREYRRERNKRLFEDLEIKRGTSMPIDEMVDFIRSGRD
jgi:antitoxin FitA